LVSDNTASFWKLVGATNQFTITVDGTLTLDVALSKQAF
jgi:hypothetical protein